MTDLLACIPWPATGIGAAVGLALGYLLGRWDDTRRKALL